MSPFPRLRILPSNIPLRLSYLPFSFLFSIFLCMGAFLGVIQFPWSQFLDWAHMHPGRFVNEFDFAWAVVSFLVCFYPSSAMLKSTVPR
jgi:hypothetical protein